MADVSRPAVTELERAVAALVQESFASTLIMLDTMNTPRAKWRGFMHVRLRAVIEAAERAGIWAADLDCVPRRQGYGSGPRLRGNDNRGASPREGGGEV
jgi:hypothetical protein